MNAAHCRYNYLEEAADRELWGLVCLVLKTHSRAPLNQRRMDKADVTIPFGLETGGRAVQYRVRSLDRGVALSKTNAAKSRKAIRANPDGLRCGIGCEDQATLRSTLNTAGCNILSFSSCPSVRAKRAAVEGV